MIINQCNRTDPQASTEWSTFIGLHSFEYQYSQPRWTIIIAMVSHHGGISYGNQWWFFTTGHPFSRQCLQLSMVIHYMVINYDYHSGPQTWHNWFVVIKVSFISTSSAVVKYQFYKRLLVIIYDKTYHGLGVYYIINVILSLLHNEQQRAYNLR